MKSFRTFRQGRASHSSSPAWKPPDGWATSGSSSSSRAAVASPGSTTRPRRFLGVSQAQGVVAAVVTAGLLIASVSVVTTSSARQVKSTAATGKRPNILQLVLDDVGYGDLAPFGGEIPVPAIDSLARNGLKFTDFQIAPTCSPARAMLLTGVDNHRAGLGNMGETLLSIQKGKPGYEGILNDRVATDAEILRANGSHTYMTGK